MDLEGINRNLRIVMEELNSRSMPQFEGYSPHEMHHILHFAFEPHSPIQLCKIQDSDYDAIPIFVMIKYLATKLANEGEIKLTSKGYLPVKVVAELYNLGLITEEYVEKGISKLYKETDSRAIQLTRILLELSGMAKKRNGKLSLTRQAEKVTRNNADFFNRILTTFVSKFNWAFFDCYGDNNIGQFGFGYSLFLVSKYGEEKHDESFYSTRYFTALPRLLDFIEPNYGPIERYTKHCYGLRTFAIFMSYFGLVKIEKQGNFSNSVDYITKTDLFDKLIVCKQPKGI